jgi:hypothetical protein
LTYIYIHDRPPGKKEVPQLARMLGRGTGRMVAVLNSAREQFTKATQDTQLSKVGRDRRHIYVWGI